MFRFTIRDMLWLTALVAMGIGWFATSHRFALLEARLQSAERRAEHLRAHNDTVYEEKKTAFATFEALATAFRQAELSAEQRDSIRNLFEDELDRRGVNTG